MGLSNSILSIAIILITLIVAHIKGFNLFIWLFTSGPIGIIALLILPSAKAVLSSDEDLYEIRKSNADYVGSLVIALNVIVSIIFSIIFQNINILLNYLLGLAILLAIVYIFSTIASIIAMPIVFQKAKQPWWACYVPVYNVFALVKIAELPKSWAYSLILIPVVTPVLAYGSTFIGLNFWILTVIGASFFLYLVIMIFTEIARFFGFDPLFAIVCVLFLQGLFFSGIALSQADYDGSGNYGEADNYVPILG